MLATTLLTVLLSALPLTTATLPATFPTLSRRQIPTPRNSTCPAQQAQLESCGASLQPQIDLCTNSNRGPIDYCCLCSSYTQKLSCFDICPTSPDRAQVNKQLDFYCAAAVDPCQADCLTGLVGMVGACNGAGDNACMCGAYTVTLECFAGCPAAAANPAAEADRDGFCARAAASSTVGGVETPTPTAISACSVASRATVTASSSSSSSAYYA